jgi:hypothetical protein
MHHQLYDGHDWQKLFDLKDGKVLYCGKTCILYDAIAEENQCTKNKNWAKTPT